MPTVSIVVPCFNEARTIAKLLAAIYDQDVRRSDLEVIIADGLSSDATRERIESFRVAHKDLSIRVIDNLKRTIPAGLNTAIANARGDVIVRLDAHCVPDANYVSACLAALGAERGWNVGGVWIIRPGAIGWVAASIALAASHPLGVGDALYRVGRRAQKVDTVPFGAFRKGLIDKIGGFNESLLSNEDYEFNARIRKAGGTVWLDPAIKSIYFARATLGELARQYARYGYWKWQMLRRYPGTLRLRQAGPPLLVLSLMALAVAGFAWPLFHLGLIFEVVSYIALLLGAALFKALEEKQPQLLVGIPLAMATMHLSWGVAFLASLVGLGRRKV